MLGELKEKYVVFIGCDIYSTIHTVLTLKRRHPILIHATLHKKWFVREKKNTPGKKIE